MSGCVAVFHDTSDPKAEGRRDEGSQVIYTGGFPAVSRQAEGPTPNIDFQSPQLASSYYQAGRVRVALRRSGYEGGNGVNYILTDHLGSTSLTYRASDGQTAMQKYKPWGEPRQVSGELPTDRTFQGQRDAGWGLYHFKARWFDSYLNRWTQPDSIIPDYNDPQSFDRYAFVRNNPVNRIDPSGHADQDMGGGCYGSVEACKRRYVEGKAGIILKLLGGKDDLEAMAQIVDTAASVYRTYDEMLPVLTGVFNGQGGSNPATLLIAAFGNAGCNGIGRDPGDCPANAGPGQHFADTGFHSDFRDRHNQLFHFWAYLATVASSEWQIPLVGQILGLTVSEAGNFTHEILQRDDQSTWQDYGLSVSGMQIGLYAGLGIIPPNQLGNYLRGSLGTNGYGSYGIVPALISIIPLMGNR
jgi:RHS repeat-associated protein